MLRNIISRRFRLPDGQLLLPWPMVIDHREKSPSRFAPCFFSVGLFAAATLLQRVPVRIGPPGFTEVGSWTPGPLSFRDSQLAVSCAA